MKIRSILVGLVATLCGGTLAAQSSGSSRPAAHSNIGGAASEQAMDAKVLSQIHMTNEAEMKIGQLAESKGQSEQVREYGRRLHNDHHFSDNKVSALAEKIGVALTRPRPGTPAAKTAEQDAQLFQRLKDAQGPDFDQQFLQAMIKGHRQAIGMLQGALVSLRDPDVQGLVQRLIPILRQHLQIAEDLSHQEKSTASR